MKKFITGLSLFALLLTVALPVTAKETYDNYDLLDDIIDYWIEWAEDDGYVVLSTEYGYLEGDESQYFYAELTPGTYHVYAESLWGDDDIDLYIYDEYGDEIDSDTTGDNYPICQFTISRNEEVSFEIVPYVYDSGNWTEYALIVASEGRGDIIDDYYIPDKYDYGRTSALEDLEFAEWTLDDYMDLVIEYDLENIFDDIGLVEEGYPRTYTITLGRGDYVIYGEGSLRVTDLDLFLYDERGRLVKEDSYDDNFPTINISVRHSQTFEIDVEGFAFEEGAYEGYFVIVVARE